MRLQKRLTLKPTLPELAFTVILAIGLASDRLAE